MFMQKYRDDAYQRSDDENQALDESYDESQGWIYPPSRLEVALVDIDWTLTLEGVFNIELAKTLLHFDVVILFTQRNTLLQKMGMQMKAMGFPDYDPACFGTQYIVDELEKIGVKVLLISTSLDPELRLKPGEYAQSRLLPFEQAYIAELIKLKSTGKFEIPEIYSEQLKELAEQKNVPPSELDILQKLPNDKVKQWQHLVEWIQKEFYLCSCIHFTFIDDSEENLSEVQKAYEDAQKKQESEQEGEKEKEQEEIHKSYQLTVILAEPQKKGEDYVIDLAKRQMEEYIQIQYKSWLKPDNDNRGLPRKLIALIENYEFVFDTRMCEKYNNLDFNNFMYYVFFLFKVTFKGEVTPLFREHIQEILTQIQTIDGELITSVLPRYIYDKLRYGRFAISSQLPLIGDFFPQEEFCSLHNFLKDLAQYIRYIATLDHESYKKSILEMKTEYPFLAQLEKQDEYYRDKIISILNFLRHIQKFNNSFLSDAHFDIFWKDPVQTNTKLQNFYSETERAIKANLVKLIEDYQADINEILKKHSSVFASKKSDIPEMLEEWKDQLTSLTVRSHQPN